MNFRFYSNALSQASKNFAAGAFIVGLMLIGFGLLIYLLPRFFATLAAIVFFLAGGGCAVTAIKIFYRQRQIDKLNRDDNEDYRNNVRIHYRDTEK